MQDNIRGEITALKSLLRDTDYKIIKSLETLLSCDSLQEMLAAIASVGADIRDAVSRRAQWRAEINRLEEEQEE